MDKLKSPGITNYRKLNIFQQNTISKTEVEWFLLQIAHSLSTGSIPRR
jgi:hypothetical protein